MSDAPCQPTPADPASHEPFEARPEAGAGLGPREPDPTDEFMGMLKRLAVLGMALTEDLVADAREAIAARRAARAAASAAAPPGAAAVSAADPPAPELRPERAGTPRPGLKPELTAEEHAARDPSMLAFHRMTRAVRLSMALALKFQDDRWERERKTEADRAVAEQERKTQGKRQLKRAVEQAIERERKERRVNEYEALYELPRILRERLDQEDIERDLAQFPRGELIARICRDLGIEPDWDLWRQDRWAVEEARLKPAGSPYADTAAPAEAAESEAAESEAAESEAPEPETPESEPAEPAPDHTAPDRTEPDYTEPDEPKPAGLKPPEADPPDTRPPDTGPETPAAPTIRSFDRTRALTPEQQRADAERAAYIRSLHYNGL